MENPGDARSYYDSGSALAPYIQDLRHALAEGEQSLRLQEYAPGHGFFVATELARLRDRVLQRLWEVHHSQFAASGSSRRTSGYAVMALGGYGRGAVSPHSDVDLLVLSGGRLQPAEEELLGAFFRDVYDLGFKLGFVQLTPKQAIQKTLHDPHFATAILSARFLWGSHELWAHFHETLLQNIRRHIKRFFLRVEQAWHEERERFGDTVFVLQPNVKRSPGGLRDLQFIDWTTTILDIAGMGGVQQISGILTPDLKEQLKQTEDFLLQIRHALHWRNGRAEDLLSRSDQWLLADQWQYPRTDSLLAVEVFMRDYFRRTEIVAWLANQIDALVRRSVTQRRPQPERRSRACFVSRGEELGLTDLGKSSLAAGWPGLFQAFQESQRRDKPLDQDFWMRVWTLRGRLGPPTLDMRRMFVELCQEPKQLAGILRGLHRVGLLEHFVPAMATARGLLQFNVYHKYTVDEHCLRAVEAATRLAADAGLLGQTYRQIGNKRILHLALLLHDLGKGLATDHCEAGAALARETAQILRLSADDAELLEFLVGNHLRMNHLALRRDISDQQLVVSFAVEVGSPKVLRMLYVLTAADLMAVSPDNWTAWKADLLAELYQRTIRHLSDAGDVIVSESDLQERREAALAALQRELGESTPLERFRTLPAGYLLATDSSTMLRELYWLAALGDRPFEAHVEHRADQGTDTWTVLTRESVAKGIFHRLTGALTSQGLEILAAQIYTLPDGLIIDRFVVRDPYDAEETHSERVSAIHNAIGMSLTAAVFRPTFPRRWDSGSRNPAVPRPRVRVEIDNSSLTEFTLVEVFANDRPGLLYDMSRTLYEAGCSVWRAKIGTFLDQVVDVFYLTGSSGEKIEDAAFLARLKENLSAVLQDDTPHPFLPLRK